MKTKFNRDFLITALIFGLTGAGMAQLQPAPTVPVPGQFKVRYYGQFSELPVGSVQPRGWIQKWLERQAQGLTGHPENMSYPYDTCMYAGIIPPPSFRNKWWKEWWPYEQSGYFVDATTRLSWLINDSEIRQRRDANLDYILSHASGTNFGGSHWCWPNAVVGRALMAEFSATGDPRVAAVMQNWLVTSAREIARGGRNGANFEEAFYLYGLTGDPRLLELCRKIYEGYLHDTNSFCTIGNIKSREPFHEHGVTAAEELKCLPLMFSYTGNREALRLAERAYRKVLNNCLMADGGIVSDEHLEPTAFDSVHESCDITDWSWSLGYLFMATGGARFADLIERTTFNALPGAVTKDFKQLQYFSAVNQTEIATTNCRTPRWPTRMTYRAAHDVECCAGNINRVMPNYVIRMWMRANDGGLAAVYYGPSEVTSSIGGQTVTITEETDYPFRDHILFRFRTTRPITFNFQCRIPQWCSEATLRLNGTTVSGRRKPGTFTSLRREFHDGDVVDLILPMPVQIERWFDNRSVCVTRGPLVFSLKIAEERIEHTNDPPTLKPVLAGHDIQGFPEVEFLPRSDWRYGFNRTLKNDAGEIKVVETMMPDNPFLEDQTPVRLELPLCRLPNWSPEMKGATIGEPEGLPTAAELRGADRPQILTLVPYGSTHLRLTTLPVIPITD
ncbi:MAG TPA: beta-L-arabinofuranosidase domain-containing protein [Verrucomicrobiae bacterium]|nr:beta-L-arabinofuranosidase domain-containing protein [Verrucomicrobiae bacterium]